MNVKTKRILSVLLALALALACVLPAFAARPAAGYKNVIIMIGDGMGENHLMLARENGVDLFMDTNCDLCGQSKTRSFSDEVTDSAAGGTALACGVRVSNSALGVYPIDPNGVLLRPRNFTENAIAHGMKTGVVTTDKTTGATPASFSAHTSDRGNTDDILAQQLAGEIDLIWGAAEGTDFSAEAEANGFTYVTDKAGMDALTVGERSFGQFTGSFWHSVAPEGQPTLAEMSVKAIELLDENNPSGFFLMIEGAHIDKNSHSTSDGMVDYPDKVERTVDAMRAFDDAIRAVVEFARADGSTVVLVTADHETGDLYYDNGRYTFHSGSHTGNNVPVLVYGAHDLFTPGKAVKNKEIPGLLAAKLGWNATEFPQTDPGTFWQKLLQFLRQPLLQKAA